MVGSFNSCIAIGVADRHRAATEFVELFGGRLGKSGGDWIEVFAGPFTFYFVEDGTRDLAFSIDVDDVAVAVAELDARGFAIDRETTDRVGETFVLSPDGVRINLTPTSMTIIH